MKLSHMKISQFVIPLLAACLPLSAWSEEIETEYGLVYVERDEQDLKCDIYYPKGKGPFPAVLVVHGGGWTSGSRIHMAAYGNKLAKNGIVAVAIQYRLAPKHKWPAHIEDVREALRFMRAKAAEHRIDPKKIGALGYSAGAHLVCMLAYAQPKETGEAGEPTAPIQVVAAGGTPAELEKFRLTYFLGGTAKTNPAIYKQASPVTHVSKDDPPTLLFHGDKDRLVKFSHAEALEAAMTKAGAKAEILKVAGKGHLGTFLDGETNDKVVDYLVKQLKN